MTITSGYCSSTESQSWIAEGKTFTAAQLAKIDIAVEAASRMIDEFCRREAGAFIVDSTTSSRVYAPLTLSQVYIDDIGDTSGLAISSDEDGDGTYERAWSAADFQLEPLNALAKGRPINALRAVGVKVFPLYENVGSAWVGVVGSNRSFYSPGAVSPLGMNRAGQGTIQVTAKWGWPAIPTPIKQATIIQSTMLYQAQDAPAGLAGTPDMGTVRYPTGLHPSAVLLVMPYIQNAGGLIP